MTAAAIEWKVTVNCTCSRIFFNISSFFVQIQIDWVTRPATEMRGESIWGQLGIFCTHNLNVPLSLGFMCCSDEDTPLRYDTETDDDGSEEVRGSLQVFWFSSSRIISLGKVKAHSSIHINYFYGHLF